MIWIPTRILILQIASYALNSTLPLFFLSFFSRVEFDAPEKWQMNFQDPATPVMEKIIDLHHDIQFFLIIIVIAVLWMLLFVSCDILMKPIRNYSFCLWSSYTFGTYLNYYSNNHFNFNCHTFFCTTLCGGRIT